ncbi:MAG: copper resistance protein B [Rhizobiaceae bacterium]|nr:copper resistance protein B [Rhizobiaceae bacterium]
MSTMNMGPPDVPTSADNPGRPPEAPVPAAALAGPIHAADLVFGADAMAVSRRTLVRENGDVRTTAVVIDRLEAGFGDDDETWLWDVQGWSGGDINRFWWKSEGEGEVDGGLEDAELQALYSRAVTPFWDVQAGVRHDFRPDDEDTTHLVLGVQGLAPYWWEIDAAAFLSTDGDLTARVEAEYDQRLTQRLILQPRLEIDLSASDIPELEIGSGLSSAEAGLRLRYEFRKEFAPYVGVEWSRSFGETADYIEARGGEVEDVRFVIGLRAWF